MKLNITATAENFIQLYLSGTKTDPDQVVDLESAIDEYTFVSKDGFLMSVIKLNGAIEEVDDYAQYKNVITPLINSISAEIKSGIHALQCTYIKETGNEAALLENSIAPARERAKNYGFKGMDNLFGDQVQYISKQIIDEDVYFAVWTNTSFLKSREIADEKKELDQSKKDLPLAYNAHGLLDTYTKIKIRHQSFVDKIIKGFNQSGIMCSKINRDKALLSISKIIYPFLQTDYKFIFPDRQTYPKSKGGAGADELDCSHMIWESISSQIVREDDIYIDLTEDVTKIGDRYFSTFEIKNPPRDLVMFNSLGDTLKREVPCMFSFYISSASSFTFFWKKMLSSLPFPNSNKRIKKSIATVALLKEIGEPDTEYKLSTTTWSKSHIELTEFKEYLKGAVSSWGNSIVRNFRGCPFHALMSSIHGVNYKTFGSTIYAPLSSAMAQFPVSRRARIWEKSALNFIGGGDILYPFLTQSDIQKFWNIGVCATMGSGKSVLLQNFAQAHLFSSSPNGEMPMIGYIDSGFSAQTFIHTLSALAPQDKKHFFKHITYENSRKCAKNILDTQLGCRSADIDQMNRIISTLVGIITPAGEEKPHQDASGLIRRLITDAYRYTSDKEQPKRYRKGRSPNFDAALEKINFNPINKTYWEIVDELFEKKKIRLAEYAQRYAVPTVQDVILQLTISNTVENSYKELEAYNSESLINYIRRTLTDALEKFPVFSGETVLDVNLAKVIVLDLNYVAKDGDVEMKKNASVFYSLARFIVSNNMFISEGLLNVVPELYLKYHTLRISHIKSIPKLLVYDEFHRINSNEVLMQIMQEMREGRKWSLTNIMASQLLVDFSKEIQELLSSIFIISNDIESDLEKVQTKFGLSDDSMDYMQAELTGPNGSRGTSMLAILKTKKYTLTQRLRFVLYPFMYWVTTSNDRDRELKDRVLLQLPIVDAINAISKVFPFGCSSRFEELSDSHSDKNVRKEPLKFMAEDIIKRFTTAQNN